MAFQNIVGKQLAQRAITTAYIPIYITPANTRAYIKDIDVCNTTALTVAVYVSLVNANDVVGTANALLYNATIPAYSTLQWTGSQILSAGGGVQVKASAVGCSITISGGEAT